MQMAAIHDDQHNSEKTGHPIYNKHHLAKTIQIAAINYPNISRIQKMPTPRQVSTPQKYLILESLFNNYGVSVIYVLYG